MKPQRFPWARAMAFGLGVLRFAPENFWRMTPRELAAAMRGCGIDEGAAPTLDRAGFAVLAARYPDQRKTVMEMQNGR